MTPPPSARPRTAPSQAVYDAILLGNQPAGLVAGALMARRGMRLLQIHCDALAQTYEDRGYQLPTCPAVFPPLRTMTLVEKALAELGLTVEFHRILDQVGYGMQLLLPRHRFDLNPSTDRRSTELEREFGSKREAIEAWLSSAERAAESTEATLAAAPPFPASTLWERLRLRFFQSHRSLQGKRMEACPAPLGDALEALTRLLVFSDPSEAPPTTSNRHPLHLAMRGFAHFPGGVAGLCDKLRARFEGAGGICLGTAARPEVIEDILFKRGKFVGIKLAGYKEPLKAPHLLAAIDYGSLSKMLPDRILKRRGAKLAGRTVTTHTLLPINLVVRDEALPLGLKPRAALFPADTDLGPVLIELTRANRAGEPVEDEAVVSAAAFFPGVVEDAPNDQVVAFGQRIEAAIVELMPFIDQHVTLRSNPLLVSRAARQPYVTTHPAFRFEPGPELGVDGLNPRGVARGLILVNRQVLPGLGVEGEIITGIRIADALSARARKRNPLT